MFGSGSGTGHESSGLSGSVLIPTQFVWPYGGRRVLLCGSFTRWEKNYKILNWTLLTGSKFSCIIMVFHPKFSSYFRFIERKCMWFRFTLIVNLRRWLEHIRMSPMEGCPTVLQVVWNLSPGYHQVNKLFWLSLLNLAQLVKVLSPDVVATFSMACLGTFYFT